MRPGHRLKWLDATRPATTWEENQRARSTVWELISMWFQQYVIFKQRHTRGQPPESLWTTIKNSVFCTSHLRKKRNYFSGEPTMSISTHKTRCWHPTSRLILGEPGRKVYGTNAIQTYCRWAYRVGACCRDVAPSRPAGWAPATKAEPLHARLPYPPMLTQVLSPQKPIFEPEQSSLFPAFWKPHGRRLLSVFLLIFVPLMWGVETRGRKGKKPLLPKLTCLQPWPPGKRSHRTAQGTWVQAEPFKPTCCLCGRVPEPPALPHRSLWVLHLLPFAAVAAGPSPGRWCRSSSYRAAGTAREEPDPRCY